MRPLSRREFVRNSVAAATAAVAGLPGAGLADFVDPLGGASWDRGD
ncbi:MAG TPA: twin-arginine translocation signal domain-containing protein [Gammaproteobacteria bacterium]|nr:twin-arginine translocation signal domain-containing protein [Gammaproteobacteria bacterium]